MKVSDKVVGVEDGKINVAWVVSLLNIIDLTHFKSGKWKRKPKKRKC
jgi:hypothetical protein